MSINKTAPFDIFKTGCPFAHYVKVPALLKENPVWGNPGGLKECLPFAAALKKERAWAEAWLLSALSGKKESNRVKINGQAGTISDFFTQGFFSAGFTTANFPYASFPFLVKIISAEKPLSIHVHPSEKNFPRTKSEYFLALEPSQIITGFVSDKSKNRFMRLLKSGGLNKVTEPEHQLIKDLFIIDTLNPGDILTVANTPHALLKGTLFEFGNSNNVSLRAFDWDRPTAPGRDINPKEFGKNVASPKASIEMMNRFRTENSLRALARQGLKGPGIIPLLYWAPLDAKYPGAGFQEVANSLHELRIGNGEAIDLGQSMKALGSVSEETRGLIIGYYFVMGGWAKFSASDGSLPAKSVTRRQGEGLLCPPALEKTKITALADDTVVLLLERRVDLKRLQKSPTEFRNLTTIKSKG